MEARLQGTIRVTDQCTFVDSGDFTLLLVWPADRTTWDADDQRVTLASLDGETVTWSDGDRMIVGGGGSSASELGLSPEQHVARMEWVAAPDSRCPAEHVWIVGEPSQ